MKTKACKRIHTVTVRRMMDESPDTSWIGGYSNDRASEFSIDRAHSLDCNSQNETRTDYSYQHTLDDDGNACIYCDLPAHAPNGQHFVDGAPQTTLNTGCDYYDYEQDCDCNGGCLDRGEYRYFNPSFNYVDKHGKLLPEYAGKEDEVRQYVQQDYKRMERLHRGDWCFVGVMAEAQVSFAESERGGMMMQEITSGGLWGIESDSDAGYFKEVEAEELQDLRRQLEAAGFSKRAVTAAFRKIERKDD